MLVDAAIKSPRALVGAGGWVSGVEMLLEPKLAVVERRVFAHQPWSNDVWLGIAGCVKAEAYLAEESACLWADGAEDLEQDRRFVDCAFVRQGKLDEGELLVAIGIGED